MTVLVGDCRASLEMFPDQYFNCCVTSPPYFGLRDYGHEGQLGLEATAAEYVANLIDVFRSVRRVLRDDGTLWLNLGDSYASFKDGKAVPDTTRGESPGTAVPKGSAKNRMSAKVADSPIKNKDLIGIPWRVAFALQADGWYLRQDIIWHKPNPMPESVTDRCTKAHEYIFLLSKSPRYYFDAEAIAEPLADANAQRTTAHYNTASRYGAGNGGNSGLDRLAARMRSGEVTTKNRRSVWSVATRPYKGAHFATYPPALIEPCILAGSPAGGMVLDPFGGSGTTAEVAIRNGRSAVLCELNPEYAKLAEARIAAALS